MPEYMTPEICDGVFAVGVRDWGRRLFDALVPLPQGTTYNSYLVKGANKTAIIDTTNPGFETEWEGKIRENVRLEDVDYVVMNHAEPDHAGSIPYILARNSRAIFLLSQKGAKLAQTYFHVPTERIRVVGESDSIDLGGKTLRFIDAPWLHWPETMFTYVPESKILFPCDFFGAHTALALYSDEYDDALSFAKRYFGEIMMPFRKKGEEAIRKIENLDIAIIAPSHGPIHRKTGPILDAYRKWTAGETREKAILVYVSMWGSTEAMIKKMSETLLINGIEVVIHNMVNADVADVAKDLVDSRAIVLGTPTVLGGMHPLVAYAANLAKVLRPPATIGAVIGSYGWGEAALRQAQEILTPMKLNIVGAHMVNGPPTDEDLRKIAELAEALAAAIKAG